LAETALHPNEIDKAEAKQEMEEGEKMWREAGDECDKYERANAVIRKAEEKLASAEGRST
jgi:F-type H+-transporting ATPase subunit epsilon